MKLFRSPKVGDEDYFYIMVLTDDLCLYLNYDDDPYGGTDAEQRRLSMEADAYALTQDMVWGEPCWEESR